MFKKLSKEQLELCLKCAVCAAVVNVVLSMVVPMLPELKVPILSNVLDVFRANNKNLVHSSVNVAVVAFLSCYLACCM